MRTDSERERFIEEMAAWQKENDTSEVVASMVKSLERLAEQHRELTNKLVDQMEKKMGVKNSRVKKTELDAIAEVAEEDEY